MNSSDLAKINDTTFGAESESGLPIYAVGFADRSRRDYRAFLVMLGDLARTFAPRGVALRVLDTDEHPALARKLALGGNPTLIVYSFGQRFARWTGPIDVRTPTFLFDALITAYYKDDSSL